MESKEQKSTIRPSVRLLGNDGNAFAILDACCRAARNADWTKARIKKFQSDAMSGDYDHLLGTVMENFDVE